MNRIAFTLEDLQQEIAKTCPKGQIFQENVRLIAVSKRQSVEKIRNLAAQGQIDFGENQLQEALEKISQLTDLQVKWHFIGTLQSKKCKIIATHFDWVQSVDREKVAIKLNEARPRSMPPLKVCIQVNYFKEPQKSGIEPNHVFELAQTINELPNLQLRGLMILPPKETNPNKQASNFEEISAFYQQLKQQLPTMDTLSMGMSGDYKAAIKSGATMIRIGTSLFGNREELNRD